MSIGTEYSFTPRSIRIFRSTSRMRKPCSGSVIPAALMSDMAIGMSCTVTTPTGARQLQANTRPIWTDWRGRRGGWSSGYLRTTGPAAAPSTWKYSAAKCEIWCLGGATTAPFSKAKFLSRDHLLLVVLMANWCRVVSLKNFANFEIHENGPG